MSVKVDLRWSIAQSLTNSETCRVSGPIKGKSLNIFITNIKQGLTIALHVVRLQLKLITAKNRLRNCVFAITTPCSPRSSACTCCSNFCASLKILLVQAMTERTNESGKLMLASPCGCWTSPSRRDVAVLMILSKYFAVGELCDIVFTAVIKLLLEVKWLWQVQCTINVLINVSWIQGARRRNLWFCKKISLWL